MRDSIPTDQPIEPDAIRSTDLGNARWMVKEFGHQIRFVASWGKWLIWDGQRWRIDDTRAIEHYAKNTIRHMYITAGNTDDPNQRKTIARHAEESESERAIHAMISLARSEPSIGLRPDDLDRDPMLLNVANGTLSLRTGELYPHRPQDLISKIANVDYNPDAKARTFRRFLIGVMNRRRSMVRFLQRAFGYSLTGDCREEVLFLCYGSGANGKSTLLNTFMELIGDYGMQVPTETLLAKSGGETIPNDLARMKGSRFVVAAETEEGRRLAESKVKQLTGRDRVPARFMRGEWFDYRPQFKLWLACNHLPAIRGTDHAIWRRLPLVPFEVVIPDDQQDKELQTKLLAEKEGILAWAVEGCLNWQKHGLGVPQEVRKATADYRDEMDIVGEFVAQRCVIAGAARIAASDLYQAFVGWCERTGEKPLNQKSFGGRLTQIGLRRTRGAANGGTVYAGIELAHFELNDLEELNDRAGFSGLSHTKAN